MNFNDIIEISKKRSEAGLKEISDQLSLPFFKIKGQPVWDKTPKDIAVIGSGIGGMASGALFAKAGHKVSVLEMNKELIGGHGRCLTFGEMTYSMGPQYVWEFGDGNLGDRFLKFLDIKGTDPFIPMKPDGFERFFIGCKNDNSNYCVANFKVPLGLENFRRDLKAMFPEEGDSLDALFNEMISIYDTYKSFLKRILPRKADFYWRQNFWQPAKYR